MTGCVLSNSESWNEAANQMIDALEGEKICTNQLSCVDCFNKGPNDNG
jgi:hypothetical protein